MARIAADLEHAFSAMARAQAEAVVVFGYASYMAPRQNVAELAMRRRLPTFFTWRDHAKAGGARSRLLTAAFDEPHSNRVEVIMQGAE